jgi:quinolinate synthase
MDTLPQRIGELKRRRNAVILAHNYQPDEIQAIADFTGDSLELSRQCAQIEADVIVFCGVWFMAETAAILNPGKTVLIPDPAAGCPMADMLTGAQLRTFKSEHPGAKVVCYVNSTAEVKAESDICCTSANALAVVRSLGDAEVIFVPDRHLGSYTAEKLGKPLLLWPGFCPTHQRIGVAEIAALRAAHPGAPVLVHPECAKPVRDAADHVLSTGQMCRHVKRAAERVFIIGTEMGILYRLRTENPDKAFYPVNDRLLCPNMKKISLEKVLWSLEDLQYRVTVEAAIAARARRAIEAMLKLERTP